MRVCHRPPTRKIKWMNTYKHIVAASHSHNMILMRDFNHSVICWRDSTAGHQKSKRFLESFDDNFFVQVVQELTRNAMLNFVLTSKEELVSNGGVKGSFALTTKWWGS